MAGYIVSESKSVRSYLVRYTTIKNILPENPSAHELYRYSSSNKAYLEAHYKILEAIINSTDFNTESQSVQNMIRENRKACALILLRHAISRKNPQEISLYKKKLGISKHASSIKKDKAHLWYEQIKKDILNFIRTPLHSSLMFLSLNFLNTYRVIYMFSRFFWINFLVLAEHDRFLWTDADTDILKSMAFAIIIINLVIFALKFLINFFLALKHTVLPEKDERCRSFSARLAFEFGNRLFPLFDDGLKVVANILMLTSFIYGVFPHMVPWFAGIILLLDLLKCLNQLWNTYNLYNDMFCKISTISHNLSVDEQRINELVLKQLKLDYLEKLSANLLASSAGLLMLAGYIAILVFAPYYAVPFLFLFCTMCRVVEVNSGKFGSYFRACKESPDDLRKISEKRKDFMLASLKTLLVPVLFFALLTINWQAAVGAMVFYLSVEYLLAVNKKSVNLNSEAHADYDIKNLDSELGDYSLIVSKAI